MNGQRNEARVSTLAALARVAAIVGLLAVLLLSVFVVRVRAHLDEVMHTAGAALFRYTGARYLEPPRQLVLNGVALHVLSGSTPDSIAATFDVFETRCKSQAGQRGQTLLDRKQDSAVLDPHLRSALDGVWRTDDEHEGYVACFDLGRDQVRPNELARRVRAFLATGDLAKLGDLRFAWARRDADHTNYIALWSEGSLPLHAMFPLAGDAPGAELPNVPRPAGSRRTLCAWQEGDAPMLVSYRSAVPMATLLRDYERLLLRRGYRVEQSADRESRSLSLIIRHETLLALATAADDGVGGAVVALTRLR